MTTKEISQIQFDDAQLIRQLYDAIKGNAVDNRLTLAQKIAYKRALKLIDDAWRTMLEAN